MVMHCLLEARDGRVRQNNLWKAVPYTGEVRNKRVDMCRQPGFWKFTQEGLVEERVHPGVAGDVRRMESRGRKTEVEREKEIGPLDL